MNWLSRTELLLGNSGLTQLQEAHVLIAGVGGVGSYAAEQIARAGIGEITIVDADTVNETNRNRQIPALCSTTGQLKTEVMKARLRDINPALKITTISEFIKEDRIPELLNENFHFVVDAIDTLSPKVLLIESTLKRKIPLISSMGAGGKFDPSKIEIADISKSYHCNLARMIRKRLHKIGIRKGFKVVFSPEEVSKEHVVFTHGEENKKTTVGTISYMPAIFGCLAAAHVIRELAKPKK